MAGMMRMGTEICILLLTVNLFLKCNATKFRLPEGFDYDWMTRGGNLFIKAGKPARYITWPTEVEWIKHSWLEHNKPKPADVDLVPLNDNIKQMIVEEINNRRAKALLGAYFDPERSREFGVIPPLEELSTVEYNEDIASTTERYIQHYIFDHYHHNSFYPQVPLGENLYIEWYDIPVSDKYKTQDEIVKIVNDYTNVTRIVLQGFDEWFEKEMPYYRHYEPYRIEPLLSQLDEHFIESIEDDSTLTEEEKEKQIDDVQFGHFTALVVKNVHSVGCALTRQVKQDKTEGSLDILDYSVYFACRFGGGKATDGAVLFDMDENFLQQHGLSKPDFEHSKT